MTALPTRWEQQQERATRFWSRLLFWIALRLGRGVARLVLLPTVLYFWLTSPGVRASSRDYLRRVLPRAPGVGDELRHLYTFAMVSVDRIFILAGRAARLRVSEQRPPEVARVADSGRGCLLFTSHLGGYESMRLTGTHLHLPLKILMDRAHGARLHSMFDALNLSMAQLAIDSDQGGPALVLEIKQALDAGHMVCINADRFRGGEKTVEVDFLGGRARLPASPWLLAQALRAPLLIGFGLYRGGGRYDNHFELFAPRVEIPRDRRDAALRDCVQRYADRLAHHARSAPYNWFNFYGYWEPAGG
ncbi:MAG TPA: lipid A biosynthesis acyltransferase [Candidatus Binatia bacterium]|nr:lipid A biosynthesis acyltransferase [Candidatus Binatia bacterium]